jgi:hypothetical protein
MRNQKMDLVDGKIASLAPDKHPFIELLQDIGKDKNDRDACEINGDFTL